MTRVLSCAAAIVLAAAIVAVSPRLTAQTDAAEVGRRRGPRPDREAGVRHVRRHVDERGRQPGRHGGSSSICSATST